MLLTSTYPRCTFAKQMKWNEPWWPVSRQPQYIEMQALERSRSIAPQAMDDLGVSKSTELPTAVVAFGGNALLRRGQELTMETQIRNAHEAALAVREFLKTTKAKVCITHGNGPQVGLLAAQDDSIPLDILDAETEGQIGYILELELENVLEEQEVVTLLTQTIVDANDPAFRKPTKYIGKWYDASESEEMMKLERTKGWRFARSGDKWRRVVASPKPKGIVEAHAVSILLNAGVIVICCGGGGIPVAYEKESKIRRYGLEAVVDKDLASAVVAIDVGAETLIMLTDAEAVYDPELWPGEKVPLPSPIKCESIMAKSFEEGSMKPKVEAACNFVRNTGGRAAIGSMTKLSEILKGNTGTIIVP